MNFYTKITSALYQFGFICLLVVSFALLLEPSVILVVAPMVIYPNLDLSKKKICEDNKRKSGIYRFTNRTNGKQYIGSSIDLRRRMLEYLSFNFLNKHESMAICHALLKYGYSGFSMDILEYCDPSILIERENYYFQLLSPEYNIVKVAGNPPMLGLKHSEESKAKIGAGQPQTIKVEVHDLELNIKSNYPSISSAAKALGMSKTNIIRYLEFVDNGVSLGISRGTPVLGRYTFKKIR